MTTTEYTRPEYMTNAPEGITLAAYKRAEAELRSEEGRLGFFAHAVIYAVMNVLLIVINLVYAPEHIWFFYPLLFWGFGLFMHYLYEVRNVRRSIEEREAKVEYRARQILARDASAA